MAYARRLRPVIRNRKEEMNTEEKKLDKLKSEFLSMVSHELRTPLSSIREGTSQVFDGLLGAINRQQAEVLSIVLEEVDRLARTINDVLDISRLEAGRIVPQKSVFVFSDLVGKVISKLGLAGKETKIEVGMEVNPPGLRIFADRDRIEQVLFNLLGNALKFTPEGGRITVEAGLHQGYLNCSVADTGIGIPLADQGRIFEKFSQSSRQIASGVTGSGLGLAIARSLVEMHHGNISVESEPGRGSRFTLAIPDCLSRESIDEYLRRRTPHQDSPFLFIGVKLANRQTLKETLGDKFPPFIDRLTRAICDELDPQLPIWFLAEEGEWVSLMKGARQDEGRQRERQMRRSLERHRFLQGQEPIGIQLRVASVSFPEDISKLSGIIDRLGERLDSQTTFQPGELKRRILVVDDDPVITDFLSSRLQSADIEPLVAHNGLQAVEVAGKELPDLILLDIKLPGMDGYEVISRLKEGRATEAIPVIFLSGHPIDTTKLKEVADHYIPILEKPFPTDNLFKAIAQTLSLNHISI